ncbi:hypothetical protein HaLaN_16528 [Haematococcus lacustris]|uniref:Uncharacterized protein n=1 Tax=Haematococcus lacustris TaxID=44745 RepID=A0A699ZCR5_HAELA|nr:hypothetical protein HaLaN_16528 [Haematococcus lacustris]
MDMCQPPLGVASGNVQATGLRHLDLGQGQIGSDQASANAAAHASSTGGGKSKASAKAKADSKSGRLLLADQSDPPASA